jgi:D-alanine transaminase
MAAPLPPLTDELRANGVSAITVEDFRWGRCDIKSTALLANVLMKQRAAEAGTPEAIIVRDGDVMEGSSTSIFVVKDGRIATPPNSNRILPGTTREVALELADGTMQVTVRRVSVEELRGADEVWMSAATRDVLPVTRIDGRPVGTGKPGPLWQRMYDSFDALRERLAGTPAL